LEQELALEQERRPAQEPSMFPPQAAPLHYWRGLQQQHVARTVNHFRHWRGFDD
jgi:hypothetical protein